MEKVKLEFPDLTLNSKYVFLEEGKDDEELSDVAEAAGITLPDPCLSVFKTIYAFTDIKNRNGCKLPKKEVKKSLKTIKGKLIDIDHFRDKIVGHWLTAKIEDNKIIAYGAIFKDVFTKEYSIMKERVDKNNLFVSFEAYGNREYLDEKKTEYDLTDIVWAGGGILLDTRPAFDHAEVLEMSADNKTKTLEFAMVVEEELLMEESKMSFNWDNEVISRMICETECPSCKYKGWFDVAKIDFENNEVEGVCGSCKTKTKISLTPTTTIIKKGTKIDTATENKEKEAMEEFLKKYAKASAEELIKFLDSELEASKTALSTKDTELATIKAEKAEIEKTVADSKKLVEESKVSIETLSKEKSDIAKLCEDTKKLYEEVSKKLKDREDAERANVLKTRKDTLGEFAKDMKDEEILDDLKYENATLKKALQEKNPEKASTMEVGSKKKTEGSEEFATQKRIQEKAWGK